MIYNCSKDFIANSSLFHHSLGSQCWKDQAEMRKKRQQMIVTVVMPAIISLSYKTLKHELSIEKHPKPFRLWMFAFFICDHVCRPCVGCLSPALLQRSSLRVQPGVKGVSYLAHRYGRNF